MAVANGRILLYYCFTPIADPTAVMLWQRALCEKLGLTGRIIVSKHGINGTVGGDLAACKAYTKATREYPGFKKMEFKWSAGGAADFPRLSVKVRPELVAFGAPDEVKVGPDGVIGGGTRLLPEQVNQLVESRDDVVFFDGRNAMEAEIGSFKDAVVPDVDTTHDFIAELESGKYDHLKDKPVVTYCTGGIRCEVLSVLMKNRGFQDVYQIDGGIVRYAEKYEDRGLWEGSLYVFDERMHVEYGENPKQIGQCRACGNPTNTFHNCRNQQCRKQTLLCETCAADPATATCGDAECAALVTGASV